MLSACVFVVAGFGVVVVVVIWRGYGGCGLGGCGA